MLTRSGLIALFLFAGCDLAKKDVDFNIPLNDNKQFDGTQAVPDADVPLALMEGPPPAFGAVTNAATLVIENADKWGPIIQASAIMEAQGMDRIFDISSDLIDDDVVFNGTGPVNFTVTVGSSSNVYGTTTLNGTPTVPDDCEFQLPANTVDPHALPNALEECLVDWATANGLPEALTVSITGQATVEAFGGGPVPAFQYSNTNVMHTTQAIETDCSIGNVSKTIADNIENIEFKTSRLNAAGGSIDGPVVVLWMALVYDSGNALQASAFGLSDFLSGESRDVTMQSSGGGAVTVTGSGADELHLFPDQDTWLPNTMDALSGRDTGMPGVGFACWFSIGATPRSGFINVYLDGEAEIGL